MPPTIEDHPKEAAKANQKKLEWAVKQHLQRMRDPYQIAQYVKKAIERGAFDEALLLVQRAGRQAQIVVSWNHLINHQLKEQRLNAAIKLYNDVRARQVLPVILISPGAS